MILEQLKYTLSSMNDDSLARCKQSIKKMTRRLLLTLGEITVAI